MRLPDRIYKKEKACCGEENKDSPGPRISATLFLQCLKQLCVFHAGENLHNVASKNQCETFALRNDRSCANSRTAGCRIPATVDVRKRFDKFFRKSSMPSKSTSPVA